MEEMDSTSSEDEVMVALEQRRLKKNLATLSVPTTADDSIEAIPIPSVTEERNPGVPTAHENHSPLKTIASVPMNESPSEEIDPSSAIVVYSGQVTSKHKL